MKKIELIEFFKKYGIEHEGMNYQEMLKYYKEKGDEIMKPKPAYKQENFISVEEEKEEEKKDDFETYREKLMVKIVELMKQLRGKSNCTQHQLSTMFRLYNQYYKRAESPTCTPCVSKVYQQLKKISKKYM